MLEAAALEQRLGHMEDMLQAAGRAAEEAGQRAAAAEQRAAAAAEATRPGVSTPQPLVDTKLLGKPRSFDGKEASWRTFRFGFLGYCAAVDPDLRQALAKAEMAD